MHMDYITELKSSYLCILEKVSQFSESRELPQGSLLTYDSRFIIFPSDGLIEAWVSEKSYYLLPCFPIGLSDSSFVFGKLRFRSATPVKVYIVPKDEFRRHLGDDKDLLMNIIALQEIMILSLLDSHSLLLSTDEYMIVCDYIYKYDAIRNSEGFFSEKSLSSYIIEKNISSRSYAFRIIKELRDLGYIELGKKGVLSKILRPLPSKIN